MISYISHSLSSRNMTISRLIHVADNVFIIELSFLKIRILSVSSDAQSCPTLCDPMDCSTPGLPVHHQFPEFTQTHVHRVSDAIQPKHLLLPQSPSIRVFPNELALHIKWPKYWSFSFSISPSTDYSGFTSFKSHIVYL